MAGRQSTTRWPKKLETETDLAGFLRKKLESVGGTLTAFKTAERFLRDILADWGDPYEIAMVYEAVINVHGPTPHIWNMLDLRAYTRFRRQYAPVQGTAYYAYQATFAATGPLRGRLWVLVEALEDALLARNAEAVQEIQGKLDGELRRVRG